MIHHHVFVHFPFVKTIYLRAYLVLILYSVNKINLDPIANSSIGMGARVAQ